MLIFFLASAWWNISAAVDVLHGYIPWKQNPEMFIFNIARSIGAIILVIPGLIDYNRTKNRITNGGKIKGINIQDKTYEGAGLS